MNAIWLYLQNNGTKLLGGLVGTLGIVANTSDIIPQAQLKYWLLVIAVLTYWRGMANTQAIATAVTQQHADAITKASATGTTAVMAPAGQLDKPIGNINTAPPRDKP
jgi:hypothetical protein